jgi:hypothetical protein
MKNIEQRVNCMSDFLPVYNCGNVYLSMCAGTSASAVHRKLGVARRPPEVLFTS